MNRINILARHATDALVSTSPSQSILAVFFPRRSGRELTSQPPSFGGRLRQWLRSRIAFLRFRGVLLVLDLAFFTSTFFHWCSATLRRDNLSASNSPRKRGRGFEDDLEESMQKLAR